MMSKKMRIHSYLRCLIVCMTLTIGAHFTVLSWANPFDDAFDSFDEESIDQEEDLESETKKTSKAPRCLAPLEKRSGDPIRDRIRQKAADQNSELRKQLTLYFLDAQTGVGISGAEVSLLNEHGRTDHGGRVCFTYPSGDLMNEVLKATFEKRGYVKMSAELRFMAGALFFNRFSVSKALPPGKLRIVLDWGAQPSDLDAHLLREGAYHISYREMRVYQDLALLDRDDRDGFGPETITINRVDPKAHYSFFVRDFTQSGKLSESKAHVRVYSGQNLLKTYEIPAQVSGHDWQVFSVINGELK